MTPEPVTNRYFLSCFVTCAHALVRTGLLITGLHYTRAGRRLYQPHATSERKPDRE